MNDHIDTRDGWRYEKSIPVGKGIPFREELIQIDSEGMKHFWVRGVPVPPLPTEENTVIEVTWREPAEIKSRFTLTPGRYWRTTLNYGWSGLGAESLAGRITGFEVLSEPRAVTAKAVLDRLREVYADLEHSDFADVAREFGVDS